MTLMTPPTARGAEQAQNLTPGTVVVLPERFRARSNNGLGYVVHRDANGVLLRVPSGDQLTVGLDEQLGVVWTSESLAIAYITSAGVQAGVAEAIRLEQNAVRWQMRQALLGRDPQQIEMSDGGNDETGPPDRQKAKP
jgi:hypothetical protein